MALRQNTAARWPRHRSPSFYEATKRLEAELQAKEQVDRQRVARIDHQAHGYDTGPLSIPGPSDIWRWRSPLTLPEAAGIKHDGILEMLLRANASSQKLPGPALRDLVDYRYVLDTWLRDVTRGNSFETARVGVLGPGNQIDIALALQLVRKWIAEAETDLARANGRAA